MKINWENGFNAVSFLTSALDRGEWPASRFGQFIPCEPAPVTHWIGGRVGPRTDLGAVEKRRICCPYRESNIDHPARIATELCRLLPNATKSLNIFFCLIHSLSPFFFPSVSFVEWIYSGFIQITGTFNIICSSRIIQREFGKLPWHSVYMFCLRLKTTFVSYEKYA